MKCAARLCFACHSLVVPLTSVDRRAGVPLTPLTVEAMIVANDLDHAIEEDSGTSFDSVQVGRMSGRGSEKETGNTPISTGAPNCKKTLESLYSSGKSKE